MFIDFVDGLWQTAGRATLAPARRKALQDVGDRVFSSDVERPEMSAEELRSMWEEGLR